MAQMAACRQNNQRDGHYGDTYGIVSNGQGWVFYHLVSWGRFAESSLLMCFSDRMLHVKEHWLYYAEASTKGVLPSKEDWVDESKTYFFL